MATLHIKLPCIQNTTTNTPYKIQIDASSEARGWLAIPPVLDGSWYIQNIRMCVKITGLSILYINGANNNYGCAGIVPLKKIFSKVRGNLKKSYPTPKLFDILYSYYLFITAIL